MSSPYNLLKFVFIICIILNFMLNGIAKANDAIFCLNELVDVSGLIVDLKYDGKSIKILEFGNIISSKLSGHETLYEKGVTGESIIWERFYRYLSNLSPNVWCVGKNLDPNRAVYINFQKLIRLGGYYCSAVDLLKQDQFFNELSDTISNDLCVDLQNCNGIIINTGHRLLKGICKDLNLMFPGFIFLNHAAFNYGESKDCACNLFDSCELRQFRPKWKIYDARYSQNLIEKINNDFESDLLVIKPLNASRGQGVIILSKRDLSKTLKMIFTKKRRMKKFKNDSFNFWAKYREKKFLIEEFRESKYITVDGKQYDGTMRVVFVLSYHKKNIDLSFLGEYWKLPVKHISQKGTLNEKHKSKVDCKRRPLSVAKVSKEDAEHVKSLLSDVLPILYKKMLMQTYE